MQDAKFKMQNGNEKALFAFCILNLALRVSV